MNNACEKLEVNTPAQKPSKLKQLIATIPFLSFLIPGIIIAGNSTGPA
jgi:hypothetical protein